MACAKWAMTNLKTLIFAKCVVEFFRLMQLLKGSWCFHSDMPMTFGTYLNGKFKILEHLKYNFLKIH